MTTLQAPHPAGYTPAATVDEVAEFTALPHQVVDTAMTRLGQGTATLLVMSGKMGSGKDTLGPLVLDALGCSRYTHRYYADRLKDEVDQMLTHVRYLDNVAEVAHYLQLAWNMNPEHAQTLAGPLYTSAQDVTLTARARTPDTRFVLQYYGTNVRRAADDNHWVKPGLATMLTDITHGTPHQCMSTYVTDARFANEVDWPAKAGATVVRLQISRAEQLKRLHRRDGAAPSEEALNHRSETALDDYDFGVTVQVDGKPIADVVDEIVQRIHDR